MSNIANQCIGVIGVGDLGAQVSVQVGAHAERLFLFDLVHRNLDPNVMGVDRITGQLDTRASTTWANNVEEVIDGANTIHLCAPLEAMGWLALRDEDQSLILHDSVMSRSLQSQRKYSGHGKINIVHLLMNEQRKAVVSADSDDVEATVEHLTDIGLDAVVMSTYQHDRIMAMSQAPMALLHELFGTELKVLGAAGLLTQSGDELNHALQHRSAQWTQPTMHAILGNPEILGLLDSMRRMVSER